MTPYELHTICCDYDSLKWHVLGIEKMTLSRWNEMTPKERKQYQRRAQRNGKK